MSCNGITHEQQIFCIACDIAKYTLAHDKEAFIDAGVALARLVTEEDKQKSQALKLEHVTKCGCAACKFVLSELEKQSASEETGESFAV